MEGEFLTRAEEYFKDFDPAKVPEEFENIIERTIRASRLPDTLNSVRVCIYGALYQYIQKIFGWKFAKDLILFKEEWSSFLKDHVGNILLMNFSKCTLSTNAFANHPSTPHYGLLKGVNMAHIYVCLCVLCLMRVFTMCMLCAGFRPNPACSSVGLPHAGGTLSTKA